MFSLSCLHLSFHPCMPFPSISPKLLYLHHFLKTFSFRSVSLSLLYFTFYFRCSLNLFLCTVHSLFGPFVSLLNSYPCLIIKLFSRYPLLLHSFPSCPPSIVSSVEVALLIGISICGICSFSHSPSLPLSLPLSPSLSVCLA